VYRRSNVIFHCLSGILVYIVVLLLLRLRPKNSFINTYATVIASITSALFLLHPVQTQTVSYVIQGQLEGLSALFSLLVILTIIILLTQAETRLAKIALTIIMLALCVMSCGTKEITIVLPFLIPLIDWFFIAQGSWKAIKNHLLVHILVAITVWGCYLWLLGKNFFMYVFSLSIEHTNTIGNVITESVNQKITAGPFFISQFKVILHYLFMFVWPFSISVDYDWRLCNNITAPDCFIPLFILLFIFGFIVWTLKKNYINLIAFGLLWFFICLAPRSTIMPSTELMADYKTYLASIGWLFVIAFAIVYGYQQSTQKYPLLKNNSVIAVLIFASLAVLSLSTYTRNKVWRSGLEFWADIVEKAPNKARGYNNYGVHLLTNNDSAKAIWAFKRAIQLEPTTYPDPYNNISAAYALSGHLDLAVQALRTSIHINPYQPKAYNNIGIYLMQKGFDALAEKAFAQAIALYPHYGKAYFNLGRLYLKTNHQADAWQSFKNACTIADYDTNPECVFTYAHMSMNLRKFDEAIKGYTMLAHLQPLDTTSTLNLADCYAVTQQYDQAATLYQQLLDTKNCEIHAHHNLCELYCRQKNYSQGLAIIIHLEQKNLSYPDMQIKKAECLYHINNKSQARTTLQNFIHTTNDGQLRGAAQRLLTQMS
jgi:tetratricopeptide (TPR) repeat protein